MFNKLITAPLKGCPVRLVIFPLKVDWLFAVKHIIKNKKVEQLVLKILDIDIYFNFVSKDNGLL